MSLSPWAKPRKISEVITPELPLAPRSIAEAVIPAASPAQVPSKSSSAATAALTVIDIFVPVSPSGTGKILRSFILFFWFEILFAPEITACLRICPFII